MSELGEAEREEFELHFFSCPKCARELEECALFLDTASPLLDTEANRAALRSGVGSEPWLSRWQAPRQPVFLLMGAMLVALCGVAAYETIQNRTMRGELALLKQPRQVPEFAIRAERGGATKGGAGQALTAQDTTEIELAIYVNPVMDDKTNELFASYRCRISGAPGEPPVSVSLKGVQPGQPLRLLIHVLPNQDRLDTTVFGVAPDGSETQLASHTIQLHSKEIQP